MTAEHITVDEEEFSVEELDEWIDEAGLLPTAENGFVKVTLPEPLADHFKTVYRKESPTRILRFLECPFRWWAEWYAPAEVTEEETRPWNIAGTIVHRIYEVFYSEPAHLRTEDLFDDLVDQVKRVLNEKDYEDGLMDQETIDGYTIIMEGDNGFFKKVMREVIDSAENLYDFDEDPREVQIISNEIYMSHYVDGIRIAGKVDRTIASPETGQEIIDDWKTGKAPPSGGPTDVLTHRYLQLGIYAWLRYKTTERSEIVAVVPEAVRMLFTKALKRVRINILPEDIAAIDRLMTRVIAMMGEMAEGGYVMAKPQKNARDLPCNYCPLEKICPARFPALGDASILPHYEKAMAEAAEAEEALKEIAA